MLSRAERRASIGAVGCTGDIGPGSYTPPSSTKQRPGPSAAFAWSGQRCFALVQHPAGTAAADDDEEEDRDAGSTAEATQQRLGQPWHASNKSSSFASSSQRFTVSREAALKPGPGDYHPRLQWASQRSAQPHRAGMSSGGATGTASSRDSFITSRAAAAAAAKGAVLLPGPITEPGGSQHAALMSSPPSIPARHQSYGYEAAGPGGRRLVMTRPDTTPSAAADCCTSSRDSSSACGTAKRPKSPARLVGPAGGRSSAGRTAAGAAAPSLNTPQAAAAAAGPACKGPGWAASNTARWNPAAGGRPAAQQTVQQQLQAPAQGPSQHLRQPAAVSPSRLRCSAGGKLVWSRTSGSTTPGSAAFASKSARLHQQEADPDKATPGPGSYTSCAGGASAPARPSSAPSSHAAAACRATASSRTWTAQDAGGEQRPLFARTAGRSAAMGWGPGWQLPPSKAVGPGPAAYQPAGGGPGAAASAAGARAARLLQRASATAAAAAAVTDGAAVGGGAALPATAVVAGFGCTSQRFEGCSSISPGPGRYSAAEVHSMSAEVARRVAGASRRAPGFGTAGSAGGQGGSRGSFLEGVLGPAGREGGVPGPGCYNADAGIAGRVAAAAQRPSAGFASCSDRFSAAGAAPMAAPDTSTFDGSSMRGDVARLGPGAYLPLDDWRQGGAGHSSAGRGSWHKGYHTPPFGSESTRLSTVHDCSGAAPGPGAYASVDVAKVFRPLSLPGGGGFDTSAQRFVSHAATPDMVGPGSYVGSYVGSLIKPSFNVTLDA